MKKFLLALIVVSSLVSCGKDNKVGAASSPLSTTSPISTINSDTNFQTLGSAIINHSFYKNVTYYTEYHFGSVTNTCVTKDGWLGINYQSCSSSVSNPTTVIQGDINNVAEKQAELTAVLQKTVEFQVLGAGYYRLIKNENFNYFINTSYPIKANPLYKLNNADGKATQFLY